MANAKTSAAQQRLYVERHRHDADFKKRQAVRQQKSRSNRRVAISAQSAEQKHEQKRQEA